MFKDPLNMINLNQKSNVNCKDCYFNLNCYCILYDFRIFKKPIDCLDFEPVSHEYDTDDMDLTDSELYIRGELSSQDSEAW